MNWRDWLRRHGMESLKINAGVLEAEFKLKNADKDAAWNLYVELLTRITTQPLPEESGDEKTALTSVFSLFSLTRNIIKDNGRECISFAKIAVVMLNQKVRPFTAKWHGLSEKNAFSDSQKCKEFREELIALQATLKIYARMLADMAEVEDLTELENDS